MTPAAWAADQEVMSDRRALVVQSRAIVDDSRLHGEALDGLTPYAAIADKSFIPRKGKNVVQAFQLCDRKG